MNIVVLTPNLLGDATSAGGDISALGFLKEIASRHRLHVVAFDETSDPAKRAVILAEMGRWAASVRAIPLDIDLPRKLRARWKKMLFVPKSVTLQSSPALRDAIRQTLAENSIDLAIVQGAKLAHYVTEFAHLPSVLDNHDSPSVSKFRNLAAAGHRCLLARFFLMRTWVSWVRHESRFYPLYDHIFVVSDQDNYGLRLFSPGLRITSLPRMISAPDLSSRSDSPTYDLGFLGSFSHPPNLLALNYLFDSLLPALTPDLPCLKVVIAGRNPPARIISAAPPSVTFAGFVPSVSDFYAQVRIVVAPLLTGGGVKIKVIEGMLSGRPIVTTSIGAEGLGIVDGVHALIADTPAEFVQAILRLIDDPAYAAQLGGAGREHALTNLGSVEQHARLTEAAFNSAVAKHRSKLLAGLPPHRTSSAQLHTTNC